jgi:hypothetical protein
LAGGLHFPIAPPDEVFVATENKEKNLSMVIENVDKRYAKQNGTRGRQLLSLFAGLALALTIGASNAKAQIVGDMVAKVPFEFHAGNADFPAGEYRIHSVDDSGLDVMQISTMDGSRSALVQVQESDAAATPTKSELIFNKYGGQYFLAKLYDEGERIGSEVLKTRAEERISKNVAQAQEHVPAQRGNATQQSAAR